MKKFLALMAIILFVSGCTLNLGGLTNESGSKFSLTNESDTESTEGDKASVTGAKVKYSIEYDKNKWELKTPEQGSDAEYLFSHVDGDVEAQVIPERIGIPLESLKKIALENAKAVVSDIKSTKEEKRQVNGVEVLMMKMEGSLSGIKVVYYSYYFSGENTAIQFITYTSENLFPEYENDLTELLNGLKIDTSIPPITTITDGATDSEMSVAKGARVKYSLKYDPSKWIIENAEPGEDSEYYFSHIDGDIYGTVIPERIKVEADAIKKIALDNAKEVAPDAKIIFEETKKVNGKDLMVLKIAGTMDGVKFQYYGHYYTGKAGTIQLITYTTPELFSQYEKDMTDFLNGLEVEE